MNDIQHAPLPEPPDALIAEFIKQPSRILLLLGAGISRTVVRNNGRCLPSWNELLREMLEWAISRGFSVTQEQQTGFFELCDRGNAQALIRAGGWLRLLLGENFNDFMTETFYFTESISSPIHNLLQKLPVKGVITFNYDNLIELTFGTHLRLVATHLDEDKLAEIQRGSCPLFLLKAHGDVTNFKSIVLGSNDYHKILFQNKTYRKVLSTLFEQNTVLALGFGMEDPDTEYLFDEILSLFPNPPISIYTLVPKGKFDVITKYYWLRERKVQFLEYEQRSEDHNELPQFLSLLLHRINQKRQGITPASIHPDKHLPIGSYQPLNANSLREYLAGEYARLYEQFTLSQDAYSVAQERRRVGDEAIEAVLTDICKRKKFPFDNIAVIARGSYGLGHLCSNSDVDITFLHYPNDKEKAEEIYKELWKILTSGWGHISVRPLINTIDECASHWDTDKWDTDFSSFSSFASSRIIVGSSELHQDLRRKWIYHVQQTDLCKINEGIRKQRLKHIIEDQQGNITNIKTCAGGLMDVVHIFLLEEVLSIKGVALHNSFILDSLINNSFRFLLTVREHIYAINKTLAMTKSDISRVAQLMSYNQSQGINSTEFWALLMDHRKKIREALLSLLLTKLS